jgi:hypothetical protein
MVDVERILLDPFTLRTIFSILAGAFTALVVVRLTFFLHNQRDLFKSIRAIRAELEYNIDQLTKLSRLLRDDMQRQHVDLPIEVPAGTMIEVRYVLTLPGALNTSAFDQLKQSGRLFDLSSGTRRALFDLYDTIDRINRLRQHRETLHYNNASNVHIVIDPSELDLEPGTAATEEDFPPEIRQQLDDLRRMRRAMKGINSSVLRLITKLLSPDKISELSIEEFDETDSNQEPETPTIEDTISMLNDIESQSFWARFV